MSKKSQVYGLIYVRAVGTALLYHNKKLCIILWILLFYLKKCLVFVISKRYKYKRNVFVTKIPNPP
jgi:hypothetical protein